MEGQLCDRLMDDSSVEFQKIESMMHDQCLSDINNIGHSVNTTNRLKDRRSWRRMNPDDIPIRGFHTAVIHEEMEVDASSEIGTTAEVVNPDISAGSSNDLSEIAIENIPEEACTSTAELAASTISFARLPCDLVLRVMAMLSPRERFLLCGVSRLLNSLFCEPALWRHINLTSCSSAITDAAVETMLALTDHLEALVIRPIAPPPFLSWRFLQALAAHPCTRSLAVLVVHNCEGLLFNTPRSLAPCPAKSVHLIIRVLCSNTPRSLTPCPARAYILSFEYYVL